MDQCPGKSWTPPQRLRSLLAGWLGLTRPMQGQASARRTLPGGYQVYIVMSKSQAYYRAHTHAGQGRIGAGRRTCVGTAMPQHKAGYYSGRQPPIRGAMYNLLHRYDICGLIRGPARFNKKVMGLLQIQDWVKGLFPTKCPPDLSEQKSPHPAIGIYKRKKSLTNKEKISTQRVAGHRIEL